MVTAPLTANKPIEQTLLSDALFALFAPLSPSLPLSYHGKAKLLEADVLLSLISAYKDDDDFVVWTTVAGALGALDSAAASDAVLSKTFRSAVSSFMAPIIAKCGWDGKDDDGHTGTLLRGVVINMMVSLNN